MCIILARTKGMAREDWLKLRKKGIGGSDAGAICGAHPYSNAMAVYLDKTGDELDEKDNEAMRIGRDLEDYVAKRFQEATGFKVRRSNAMYQSSEHPFMIADVDRLIVGEDAGLECKTSSAYGADKWKDGNVPLHYALQCLHYMIVTGKRRWYIAALILGQNFVYRMVRYDEELASRLIEIERDFWQNNVLKGEMPPPDGTKTYDDALRKCFKVAKNESEITLAGFGEKLKRRAEIASQIKELSTEQKTIEQEVKLAMKDNELATCEEYKIFWNNVRSTRIDAKKLKEERPDVYEKYARETASRRFEIKAA